MQEQQKSESLMVLAGGVAHDFNNLLTGILGNADLMRSVAAGSDQRRAAEAIVIGAQRAADLVSKMLAYAGGGRVVAERVDLDALVRRWSTCWGLGRAPLHADLQQSRRRCRSWKPIRRRLRQVVLNLIVNAAEAVDDAG